LHIIPVIDLLNGAVVHAKQGARHNYQPIKSLLTASSQPLDVVAALLDLYPFTQLYIADLNAIQKLTSNNFAAVSAIATRFPRLEIWLDAGLQTFPHASIRHIFGSENFAHLEDYLAIKEEGILSLDFMPESILDKPILDENACSASQYPCAFQGGAEFLENAKYWPKKVIVMALAQVGANAGVNVDLLQKILALKTDQNIYAAGGVRGLGDLITLRNIGVHGALIATALHQLQISSKEIEGLFS
jgi:phosphoribosylformimino-5-aminoimidazole carboxamide ribotide isomerase